MKNSIKSGLKSKGTLPGELQIRKRALTLYENAQSDNVMYAYAYAVSEENASGGTIVTAPTCGASGIIPAVLYNQQIKNNYTDEQIVEALAVGGLFGLVVKTNATVSGAEGGCQAEVGTATAMAAAALAELKGSNLRVIEAAAEIGLEHKLGLTCDPVLGYVQMPCIQRNAVATSSAMAAYQIAKSIGYEEQISFDTLVKVMYETGKDLAVEYRETSQGGLAKEFFVQNIK